MERLGELVSCEELVLADRGYQVFGVVDLARVVEVGVLDDGLDHVADGGLIQVGVYLLVPLHQLFFAELAVLVRVELLEQVLQFFYIVVVDDVGDYESQNGLNKLTLILIKAGATSYLFMFSK